MEPIWDLIKIIIPAAIVLYAMFLTIKTMMQKQNEAKIIGIDSQSGTLILNAGEKQQVRIGMTFRILRGKSQIAEARIAEVRPEIAAALVIRLDNTNNAVRPGDIASIKTQN